MPFAATAGRFAWMLFVFGISSTPAMAQHPTGDEIFHRSAEAYQNLSTYSGTTAVVSETFIGDTVITHVSTAEIFYERPGRYRIVGHGIGGQAYQVTGDSTGSRLRIVSSNSAAADALQALLGGRMLGDTLVTDSLTSELAIMTVTGMGNRAPFYKPALLGLVRGVALERPDAPIRLIGEEPCGTTTCYVLVIEAPTMRIRYWIDSSSYLLRQLQQEQTSAQWSAVADELRHSDANGSVAPILDGVAESIRASIYRVVFSNVRVNEPVDGAFVPVPDGVWDGECKEDPCRAGEA